MSSLAREYLEVTQRMMENMRDIPHYTRSADFDILSDRLTRLWRLMTEEERRLVEKTLR